MTNIELLNNIWNAVYAPEADTAKVIEKYFHPDYEQCINGVILNRTDYIQHVIAQKQNITVDAIHYLHAFEKGNELFAIYYPRGKNTNNFPIEAEVIAYFCFKKQQILRIHGQVRLIKGDIADVDMQPTQ